MGIATGFKVAFYALLGLIMFIAGLAIPYAIIRGIANWLRKFYF